MRRKKKERQHKKKFKIHPFLLFFILVLISIPFTLSLVDWFAEQQIIMFSSPDRLIFVQNSQTVILLVGIPLALIFCFISFVEDLKKESNLFSNKYLFLGILIVLVGGVFIGNGFYSYMHFDKLGIQTRNGLFTKGTTHDWQYVESVTTSYYIGHDRRGGENISLHYDLHMTDGSVVNLYGSPDFFTHIIMTDQYLQRLGIPISRSGIHPRDYGLFMESFKGPGKLIGIDRLEVIEEILLKRIK